jgi:hypothetical protein
MPMPHLSGRISNMGNMGCSAALALARSRARGVHWSPARPLDLVDGGGWWLVWAVARAAGGWAAPLCAPSTRRR